MKMMLYCASVLALFASSAGAQAVDKATESSAEDKGIAAERGVRMWKSEPVNGEDLVIVASVDEKDSNAPLDITMTGAEQSVDWPASLNSAPTTVQNP